MGIGWLLSPNRRMTVFARHVETTKNLERRHGRTRSAKVTMKGEAQLHLLANLACSEGVRRVVHVRTAQARVTAVRLSRMLGFGEPSASTLEPYNLGVMAGLSEDESWQMYPTQSRMLESFRNRILPVSELEMPGADPRAIAFDPT